MSETAIDPPYTVVVGVSVTSKSPDAVAWASAQATGNHGRLIAVRVLKRSSSAEGSATSPSEILVGQSKTDQQTELAADVAETLGPDHEAECRVLYGGKRECLLAASGWADLLVIDAARSPSASSRLAHRIIMGSQCPVVVLPPSLTGEGPSWISRTGQALGQAVGTSGRPGYRPPEQL